jgi:Protein of unknown function (DUF3574)
MKRLESSRIFLLILVLVTVVPATAVAQQGNNAHVGSNWSRTELFFGTAVKGGDPVTDEQFRVFLDSEITPRFPLGLTVLTGYGQFLNSTGVIQQERSFVLILLYPPSSKDSNRKIEEIRALYKIRFNQESVLRADTNNAVSF